MLKFIDKNIDLLTKYSRYYMGVSIILFLLLKNSMFDNIGEKLGVTVFILVGYLIFGYMARVMIITNNWLFSKRHKKYMSDRVKKTLKFQLNFFIIVGIFGMVMMTIYGVVNFKEITFAILMLNIWLGLIVGNTKTKVIYIDN